MKELRIWIADDEDLIRRSIRRSLETHSGTEIIGESASGRETVAGLRADEVDLILLDVQMHEGTGFDVIREIGPDSMPAIVFITAFDQYAVKAFEVHALDYLLKPFDEERLHRTIERAREQIESNRGKELAEQLHLLLKQRQEQWPERLAVRSGERFDMIPVATIDWIESANNYVTLHCGSRKYLLADTLTDLAAKLSPQHFVRVHRGRIVNVTKIVAIHVLLGGTYEIQLTTGAQITSGRQYREAVLRLLKT